MSSSDTNPPKGNPQTTGPYRNSVPQGPCKTTLVGEPPKGNPQPTNPFRRSL